MVPFGAGRSVGSSHHEPLVSVLVCSAVPLGCGKKKMRAAVSEQTRSSWCPCVSRADLDEVSHIIQGL